MQRSAWWGLLFWQRGYDHWESWWDTCQYLIYLNKKLEYHRIKTNGSTNVLKTERKVVSIKSSTPEHSSNPFTPESSTLRKTTRRAPQTHNQKVSLPKIKGQGVLSFPQNVKVEASWGINREMGLLKPCMIVK